MNVNMSAEKIAFLSAVAREAREAVKEALDNEQTFVVAEGPTRFNNHRIRFTLRPRPTTGPYVVVYPPHSRLITHRLPDPETEEVTVFQWLTATLNADRWAEALLWACLDVGFLDGFTEEEFNACFLKR